MSSSNATANHSPDQDPKMLDPIELAEAFTNATMRMQKIMGEALGRSNSSDASLVLADLSSIGKAFAEAGIQLWQDPVGLIEKQIAWGQEAYQLWQNSWLKALGEPGESVIAPPPGDKRFRDHAWEENSWFDFVKQSYLLTSKYINTLMSEVDGLDEKTRHKIEFYTRQLTDAISPSNFWATNPEVLRATLESGGENLVKGLNNMLDDLESGGGQLDIKMTDLTAFKVGENIATTPGKIVFQNHLFQLIQYSPSTETVAKRPLLVIPPWINKYYILDLQAKNSFLKWTVDQGHTTFVVSWVNPDERHIDVGFDTYMTDGVLTALDAVTQATGEESINVIGYCIGGTLLACTLSYLASQKKSPV
ncbi:MAG: PHA/PHB synthase family protein, partial [Holosporaceae bacterium]